MTLKMTSAQVVETSVTSNGSFQNYHHPDDHTIRPNHNFDVQYLRSTLKHKCCMSLLFSIQWIMAAILHDSVAAVVVVRTRPRAITLGMVTMRKSICGFPFPFLYEFGVPLDGPPELYTIGSPHA